LSEILKKACRGSIIIKKNIIDEREEGWSILPWNRLLRFPGEKIQDLLHGPSLGCGPFTKVHLVYVTPEAKALMGTCAGKAENNCQKTSSLPKGTTERVDDL
jgi:hypothetical protein